MCINNRTLGLLIKSIGSLVLLVLLNLVSSLTVHAVTSSTHPTLSTSFSYETVAAATLTQLTYSITANEDTTDIALTNTLPTGVTVSATPDISTDCTLTAYSADADDGEVTWQVDRLSDGESCSFSLYLLAPSTGGTYTNTASLTSSAGSTSDSSVLTVDATMTSFSMAFSPESIAPKATSRLTYTLDNLANSTYIFAGFTTSLPTGLTIAEQSNLESDCPDTITAEPGASSVTLTPASTVSFFADSYALSAGEDCSVSVDITGESAGDYDIITTLTSSYTGYATAGVTLSVDYSLAYMAFSESAKPGDEVELTYHLSNFSRESLDTLTFTNNLEATLTGLMATSLPEDGFCGSNSAVTGTDALTISGVSLDAGDSCSFSVTVVIPETATAGSYTNTTSAIEFNRDGATTEPAISNLLEVTYEPEVTLELIDSPALPGSDVIFRYTITNSDPINALSAISLYHDIISVVGVASYTYPDAGSCGSGSFILGYNSGGVSLLYGSVDAGSSCSFDVTVTLPDTLSSGLYTFTSEYITATLGGETVYGNQAEATLEVTAAPTLQLSLSEATAVPGDNINLELNLNYSENATDDVSAVGFSIDLDDALSGLVASSLPDTSVCGSFELTGTSQLTLSNGSFSPGESCQLSIPLLIPDSASTGTYTIESTEVSGELQGTTVTSAASSDSFALSLLEFAFEFSSATLPGENVSVTYTITNHSDSLSVTSLQFSDSYSSTLSGLTVSSLPSETCGSSSSFIGSIGAAFGLLTGGSLDANSACSFTVELLVPESASEGVYTPSVLSLSGTLDGVNQFISATQGALEIETLSAAASTAENPTYSSPFDVSLAFSREVSDFNAELDLSITNGSITSWSETTTDQVYSLSITPAEDGDVTLRLNDSSVYDAVYSTKAYAATDLITISYSSISTGIEITQPTTEIGVESISYAIQGTSSSEGSRVYLYLDSNNDGVPDSGTSLATEMAINGSWSLNTTLLAGYSYDYLIGWYDTSSRTMFYVDVPTITNTLNAAPTISGTPSTSVNEDSAYSFTPSAKDLNGDALTYSIDNRPGWATFSASTGALTGTPLNAHVGVYDDIAISVSDGTVSSALGTFDIEVINTNDAPTISGKPATSVAEDSPYSFTPTAKDVDSGDTLTFSINTTPDWADFDASTGKLSGTPTNADVGTTDNLIISVSDGKEKVSLSAFSIEVTNTNDDPDVTIDTALTTSEDSSGALSFNYTDIDGDVVSATLATPASNGTVTISDTTITYTPDDDFNGTDTFVITLTDGNGYSYEETITVTVESINDAPVAIDDSYTVAESDDGSYSLSVLTNDTDIENDMLSIEWASTNTGFVSIVDDTTLLLETDEIGEINLSYGVSDGNNGSDTGHVTVVIEPTSTETPTITAPDDVDVDATALFTDVNLGVAVATDSSGKSLAVSLVDETTYFLPGEHTVYWKTEDLNGKTAQASQMVTVHPLITISKDGETTEGANHSVSVYLNGEAPSYPVTVSYTVGGSSDSSDHDLVDGEVIIESGTKATITFSVYEDEESDNQETLIITLDESLNLGSHSSHTLTIYEGNVAPEVSVTITQDGEERSTVVTDEASGNVTVSATVTDVNIDDSHTYTWINDNSNIANISSDETQFEFDPSSLSAGYYQLQLEVDDGTESVITYIYIEVTESLEALTGEDSDGDLIPDDEEGHGDSDNDGIPDFKDAIDECNVLQEEALESGSYLVEADSGICLRVGSTVANSVSGGTLLTNDEVAMDLEANNIGGIFDFIAYDLPTAGQSVNIVFPQRLPIPTGATYRKYDDNEGLWVAFMENDNNYLSSTEGEAGYCPPPGDNAWEAGLIEGYWCVQVTIEDGGPNDDDDLVNATIVDPGGVANTDTSNTLPQAVDDSISIDFESSVDIDVLANDSDDDGDTLTIISIGSGFGRISTDGDVISYTAADDYYGTETVNYAISDGNGGTAMASMTIEVTDDVDVIENSSNGGSMGGLAVVALGLIGVLRRYGFSAIAIPLTLVSLNSHANWFMDSDIGMAKASYDLSVENSSVLSSDNQDTAWSAGLGYRLSPDWAVSGRYLDMGEASATLSTNGVANADAYHALVADETPVLAQGFTLEATRTLMHHDKLRLQASLGLLAWQVKFSSDYQSEHITSSDYGVGPYIGLGAAYDISKRWQAGWQLNQYGTDYNDISTFTLRFTYQFGSESL